MGYTHYWRQEGRAFAGDEWAVIMMYARDIVKVAEQQGICLANGLGERGTSPIITEEEILLNGVDEAGYETFHLQRFGRGFNFCKTARNAYDPVVVTILHAAQTIAPDAIRVSSDGDQEDGAGMFHFTDQVKPPTAG